MTREQAKELLPAITHFANGGELVSCRTDEEWFEQSQVYINTEHLYCSNIIEDKHFEARKAFALGEEVEQMKWDTCNWGEFEQFHENGKYRVKPKEVYEWQWYYKRETDEFIRLTYTFSTEQNAEKGWVKFEPSKRLRKDT